MHIIEKAKIFATAAHGAIGQKRKYTGEPYIVHPEEVAALVNQLPNRTDEMIAAAWLHDVVEDTKITADDLTSEFGAVISNYVWWLTDISRPEDGNRQIRKAMDRRHNSLGPMESQTIKIADIISNTKDITKHDSKFAKIYIEEKEALLDVLSKGNSSLKIIARRQIWYYRTFLASNDQKIT